MSTNIHRGIERAARDVAVHSEAKREPIHPQHVLRARRDAQRNLAALNGWLADHITALVGTMWMCYAFVALAFFGLPAALGGPKDFVAWASSQFIQLVLLPVILVAQNRANERDHVKDETDHHAWRHLYTTNDQQLEILKRLDAMERAPSVASSGRGKPSPDSRRTAEPTGRKSAPRGGSGSRSPSRR